MEDAELITGGNISGEVLHIGSTVRKPWTGSTPNIHSFMSALRRAGVCVPRVYGSDEQSRQIIEFIPGLLASDSGRLTHSELHEVGVAVPAIHAVSAEFIPSIGASWDVAIPPPAEELICHNDLARGI